MLSNRCAHLFSPRILALAAPCLIAGLAHADRWEVTVEIESLTPDLGTFLTPVWVGFHDGTFDLYDGGVEALPFLERLAEDGNNMPVTDEFDLLTQAPQGTILSDVGIPPIGPGETATMSFIIDDAIDRYFSYASMILPSNDAFIANGNPLAHPLFTSEEAFQGADFIIVGSSILDAGTEVNSEIPEETAFFGQTVPDTGQIEGGVVVPHPGFLPVGSGGILDDPMFANADFTAQGYQVARIIVTGRELCDGDVDASDTVDFTDLLQVLAQWGPCSSCPADLNGDNQVGFVDLMLVLANWENCH